MRLEISNNTVEGPDVLIKGEHPIIEARLKGERVFVVYDWMSFDLSAPARNLYCYDRKGAVLWRANDIGAGRIDAYTAIVDEEPLWVHNFAGYKCQIDEDTGAVLHKVFTK